MAGVLRRVVLGGVAAATLVAAFPALAQPTVRGSVTGELSRGRRVRFSVTATHPDGWQSLETIQVVLSLRGVPLEELSYEIDNTTVWAGGASALVGTGDQATGSFFAIDALNVEVTTGGDRLGLKLVASLLDNVPEGARFEFVAEDVAGQEAAVRRVAVIPEESGGFPWATVAVAVAAALLAGGFLGSRVATHRRPPSKSIYQDVARRIVEERRQRGEGPGA
jgi:hypothetical protein